MKLRSLAILFLLSLFSYTTFSQRPPVKKNTRPSEETSKEKAPDADLKRGEPVYFYEFEKAEFLVSQIRIEHDENGLGQITFRKKNLEEDFTEPLKLSASTLKKIKDLWATVKFLESGEPLQSKQRDYAHLGAIKLKILRRGDKRSQEFNWTENLDARALANEYRKIGNQVVWMFDFDVARKNQPLRTPRLMEGLDSYLRRNAIADPKQMMPFLKTLSEDESVPLIARNHATRLVKRIESIKEKKSPNPDKNNKKPDPEY